MVIVVTVTSMYLVDNAQGQPYNPYGLHFKTKTGGGSGTSEPAWFDTEEEAKAFAEFCARKWPNTVVHLFKLLCSGKTSEPPVEWK